MTEQTIHAIVHGKVQGVYFRAHTQDKAKALGLSGWVRNRYEGNVEVVASGTEQAIETFKAWLWQGSPCSEVSNVEYLEVDLVEGLSEAKFEVWPTK